MGLVICERKNADESRRGRMASKILVNVRKNYKGVQLSFHDSYINSSIYFSKCPDSSKAFLEPLDFDTENYLIH